MVTEARARLVLLAGPSGSGKSRLVNAVRCPRVNLDDFYRDEDDPANPRTTTTVGADEAPAVDWDDVGSWDAAAALAALVALCETGTAEVPTYDISTSRRTGTRSAAAVTTAVEKAIRDGLGMDVAVVVRTAAQLAKVVATDPFAGTGWRGPRGNARCRASPAAR